MADVNSIDLNDLPKEFDDKVFDIVDEFIRKTSKIDFECLIYFDYMTGKILRCVIGTSNNVKMNFDECEFDGYHVASIHNHPANVFSPCSGKNFGILMRSFEDYELVVGLNEGF